MKVVKCFSYSLLCLSAVFYLGSASATGVAVEDVNLDSIPDVIVTKEGAQPQVFLGKGDGTFESSRDSAANEEESENFFSPAGIEYTPGLKAQLGQIEDDAVVLIINRNGDATMADRDGNLATQCAVPTNKARAEGKLGPKVQGKLMSDSDLPNCKGLDKGYLVEAIANETVLFGGPNPHGCWYCYTRVRISGAAEQVCRPTGCANH